MKIITRIQWDIAKLSLALQINNHYLIDLVRDGRSANFLVSAWLASNGFERRADGRTGYYLIKDGKQYRLRVGRDVLSLAPSGTKGKGREFTAEDMAREVSMIGGFLLVFTIDLPENAPVWAVDSDMAEALWHKSFWSKQWNADAVKVREYLNVNYGDQ